jgi:hypothetical protein
MTIDLTCGTTTTTMIEEITLGIEKCKINEDVQQDAIYVKETIMEQKTASSETDRGNITRVKIKKIEIGTKQKDKKELDDMIMKETLDSTKAEITIDTIIERTKHLTIEDNVTITMKQTDTTNTNNTEKKAETVTTDTITEKDLIEDITTKKKNTTITTETTTTDSEKKTANIPMDTEIDIDRKEEDDIIMADAIEIFRNTEISNAPKEGKEDDNIEKKGKNINKNEKRSKNKGKKITEIITQKKDINKKIKTENNNIKIKNRM